MATQKRQASVLGSTLTSLTLNSDLSSSEEETSEAEDEDVDDAQHTKESADSDVRNDKESGKSKDLQEKDVKKKLDKPKPRVRMKTLTIDGQLVYFCVLCDKVFTRRKDKLNHELAHSSQSVLTCTECGKEYFHESSLAYHMRSHDGDQLHLCELCPKMFAQGHHLKSHILTHSQPTEFTCKTCYQDFALASDLSEHIRNKIKEEMDLHWCKICKLYFCRNHCQVKFVNKLHAYRCTACNELFFSQKKLRLHMKKFAHKSIETSRSLEPLFAEEAFSQSYEIFSTKKGENCEVSKLTTSSSANKVAGEGKRRLDDNDNYDFKMRPKRRRLPSKCFIAENIYSSSSLQESAPESKTIKDLTLKSPLKGRKGKPYCKKCNKSFKDISELDSHKLLAHGETPRHFSCEICQQRFPSQVACDQHTARHRKEEMHTCPVCNQDFYHMCDLAQHLREHSGDFPYKCSQCEKAFRLKLQLIQHIRLHIPQTLVACEKCNLQFSSSKELDLHLTHTHGEEDEFKCHLCNKVFQFRYKLQNHLRLHTNVKTFQCYICHKSFATKHYLQRHLQIHLRHGMDVDMSNIIKTETEDGNKVMENVCDKTEIDVQFMGDDKMDPVVNVDSSIPLQGPKDFIQNEHRRMPANTSALKLSFKKVHGQLSSDSDESACSVLTRESEKSDPFRLSSDGSNAFKFTMAKERRRLRKKRQLSRLALCNKLNALKTEELLASLPESLSTVPVPVVKQDDSEGSQDMTVEINAVQSQADGQVTVFVDVKGLQRLSPESGLLPSLNAEWTDRWTDKENQLPGHSDMLHALNSVSRVRSNDVDPLDVKTVVLDIEMDDELMNEYLCSEKLLTCGKGLSDCQSAIGVDVANVKEELSVDKNEPQLRKSSASDIIPNDGQTQKARNDLIPGSQAFSYEKCHPIMETPHHSRFHETANVGISNAMEKDIKPIQSNIFPIQPLQSLHDLTAQIEDRKADNHQASFSPLQNKVKRDPKNIKLIENVPSKELVITKRIMSPQVSTVSVSHDDIISRKLSSQNPDGMKEPSVLTLARCVAENDVSHGSTPKSTVDSCKNRQQIRALNVSLSKTQTQTYSSYTIPSAITHSPKSPSQIANSQKDIQSSQSHVIGLPLASNLVLNPTSSISVSQFGQIQSFPPAAVSGLPHHNECSQTTHTTGGISDIMPKEFQPVIIANKSHQSNVSFSSHAVSVNSSTAGGFYSDSKLPWLTSLNHYSVPKSSVGSSLGSSFASNPLNNGQMIDTQNPVLRDVNMMELIASNQGGISVTPVNSLPVNTLQESQNASSSGGSLFRPVTPATVWPPQSASLPSTMLPHCSTKSGNNNNLLISQMSCHGTHTINSNLSALNNFGSMPPMLGHIGPPLPFSVDFGPVANTSGFGSLANFGNMSNVNQGMSASLPLPLPVANIGGLQPVPVPAGQTNLNPLPFFSMDVMANSHGAALRPTTGFNSLDTLPFGGLGLNALNGLNPLPYRMPLPPPSPFNVDLKVNQGIILPQAVGSGGMPVAPGGLLYNPHLPMGGVNIPLGSSFVPDSGLLSAHQLGLMNAFNPNPFLPM